MEQARARPPNRSPDDASRGCRVTFHSKGSERVLWRGWDIRGDQDCAGGESHHQEADGPEVSPPLDSLRK